MNEASVVVLGQLVLPALAARDPQAPVEVDLQVQRVKLAVQDPQVLAALDLRDSRAQRVTQAL